MEMSYMLELYYKPPADPAKETALLKCVSELGGRLDYREDSDGKPEQSICLTYEFDEFDQAEAAAERLRQQGEHVEGPQDYGP
jgi:hypothetical protein